jgi:hypothetical protein
MTQKIHDGRIVHRPYINGTSQLTSLLGDWSRESDLMLALTTRKAFAGYERACSEAQLSDEETVLHTHNLFGASQLVA